MQANGNKIKWKILSLTKKKVFFSLSVHNFDGGTLFWNENLCFSIWGGYKGSRFFGLRKI